MKQKNTLLLATLILFLGGLVNIIAVLDTGKPLNLLLVAISYFGCGICSERMKLFKH